MGAIITYIAHIIEGYEDFIDRTDSLADFNGRIGRYTLRLIRLFQSLWEKARSRKDKEEEEEEFNLATGG